MEKNKQNSQTTAFQDVIVPQLLGEGFNLVLCHCAGLSDTYVAENTSVEICNCQPSGLSQVASDCISRTLALPFLVTEQRVAPSGQIRVLHALLRGFHSECMICV